MALYGWALHRVAQKIHRHEHQQMCEYATGTEMDMECSTDDRTGTASQHFSTPRRPRQDLPDITTSRSNRQHISSVSGTRPTPITSRSSSPKPTRISQHDNHIVFLDRTISPIFSPDKLSFWRVRIGHSFLNIRAVPNGDRSILPFGFSWFGVRLVGGCGGLFDRKEMVWLEAWELEKVE